MPFEKVAPEKLSGAVVRQIEQLVRRAGGRLWLVGGCVRDLIFERQPRDLDLEVSGISPGHLHAILTEHFSVQFVGRAFGVFKLDGLPIDVSSGALSSQSTAKGNPRTSWKRLRSLGSTSSSNQRHFVMTGDGAWSPASAGMSAATKQAAGASWVAETSCSTGQAAPSLLGATTTPSATPMHTPATVDHRTSTSSQ